MSFLFRFMYAAVIDKRTLEPRSGLFFLLYYVIGFFVRDDVNEAHAIAEPERGVA